ncbi:DUF6270 domain-containing protein [Phenylobacterium sp.]|jgi:hypothetical protein|uniref:DUF6270 domain-containing protein n=1 Tax=Phenylobacterium sp. TaxID=1871053 RepID=UPI002F939718
MARTAIIGSCITRDLWPVRGEAATELLFISRTSLASLMAPPLAGFAPSPETPEPLGAHQHRAVIEDLRKTALARLVAFRPSHLIFDFVDERFDLLSAGGTIVTHSWELEVSGYRSQPAFAGARVIPRLSDACDGLWRDAAAEFAALVRATPLKDASLVLHSARWAHESLDAEGRRGPLAYAEPFRETPQPLSIADHNALLARYEAHFLEVMPQMAVVEASPHRLADAGHRWGASPFHYVEPYYAQIWRGLEALGVPPLSAPAAPSAPAA